VAVAPSAFERHGRLAEEAMGLIRKLIRDERGQDLAEYAIALAVITAAVGLIATAMGTDVQSLWSQSQSTIETVVNSE
jgi:Flp pilus assembly pilin Flp